MIRTHVIRSAAALDRAAWDSLAHPSLYLSYDWLRARSRTIKGVERFVLVERDGVPLAGVPAYRVDGGAHPGFLPARVLGVDDITDDEAGAVPGGVEALRRLRGTLAESAAEWASALVAGAPARYGGVSYAPGLDAAGVRQALCTALDALERQAAEDGARALAFLYLLQGKDPALEALLQERGYLRALIDAECYLPVRWDTFDGYLSSFRADGRRKIKAEIAALDEAGATVELCGHEALNAELAALERKWRVKYGRMPSVDEIVADYEELREHMAPRLRVFVARLGGRAIGFTVFLEQGDTWYARFGGFDYEAGNLFLYFNLLFYRPMRVFVERGVRGVHYALKSYQAKRSRGCVLHDVLGFVRPPAGSEGLAPLVEVVNRVQTERFAAVMSRRVWHSSAA